MKQVEDGGLVFKKSIICQGCNACVEVAIDAKDVFVRNSNDPSKQTVKFNHDEWKLFLSGIKSGEFNIS